MIAVPGDRMSTRAAHPPAGAARGALPRRVRRVPPRARRGRRGPALLPAARAARRRARGAARRARARGRAPRAHLGRPARRRAGRALRRRRGAAARSALRRRACPTTTRPPRHPSSRCMTSTLLERVAAGEPFAVGLQNERPEHTQAGARPLTRVTMATPRRQDPAGRAAPGARGARADGHGGGADAPRRAATTAPTCTTSACSSTTRRLDCERDGERLAEAIAAIWSGRAESDTLNALVIRAGLRCDDVVDPARLPRATAASSRRRSPPPYQNDVLVRASEDGARCSSSCSARASATAAERGSARPSCARASTSSWPPSAASTRTASCAASRR